MLNLWNLGSRTDLLDRRELLRIGGLSAAGLTLPALLRSTAAEHKMLHTVDLVSLGRVHVAVEHHDVHILG